MRVLFPVTLLAGALAAGPAEAARIVILTDPMTLERRMVIIDEPGPDRVFLCTMPPAVAGCRNVTPRAR